MIPINILYVTSEACPFAKTGGLGDVAGSLPPAIKKHGYDIRVVLPLHRHIKERYMKGMEQIAQFNIHLGWRNQYAGVFQLKYGDIIFYFIDNEYYFNRDNIYGEFDDGERYAYFSKAVAILSKVIDFKPDIIHTNDWHTALVNLYIKDLRIGDSYYNDIKTVFTIHNIKYQGVYDAWMLSDILGLSPKRYFNDDGIKFYDKINYMKAGIVYCDVLTTVSKTYAEEIKHQFFGEKLEGIIRKEEFKLTGIINGIDYDIYNPQNDRYIEYNYNYGNLNNKFKNKGVIQKLYGLDVRDNVPILAMITRMSSIKGIDLLKHILDELMLEDVQLIVLGTGDKEYEDMFKYYEYYYPNRIAARVYFSEREAHKIYAGADMLLMPSMMEPCGISQLIALRYGTIPVVRETGGLKDTITSYNKFTKEGNGFSFKNYNAHELLFTIKNAVDIYRNNEKDWNGLILNAMESKNDWGASSLEYIGLYNKLYGVKYV
ncbi:MAG: glycogen synthase GlgA [Alkaliphilus sp.]|nr:glycogen synthase GlgA [Alkaliphilus sp.]